jgi:ribose transport system permease protein
MARLLQRVRPLAFMSLMAIVLGVLLIEATSFFKLNNLINILSQSSTLAVMATGMAVVMIGGGIDLSLPFNSALSAVMGALYMRATGHLVGGYLIMIGCATAIGILNGVAVGCLGMIPFVVTLATMTVSNGAAVWLTNSVSVADIPDAFVEPFFKRYLGLPLTIYIAVGVLAAASVLMSRTVFGRWQYAVGINRQAAKIARIPDRQITFCSYVFAGLMAGIAAIMLTGRLASASANLASPTLVLDVVSACVVGGISIHGGAGRIYGAALGAVFLALLSNALNAAEVSAYSSQVLRGAIVIAFVALDRLARQGSA